MNKILLALTCCITNGAIAEASKHRLLGFIGSGPNGIGYLQPGVYQKQTSLYGIGYQYTVIPNVSIGLIVISNHTTGVTIGYDLPK